MNTGLHAMSWGLSRLGVALAATVLLAILAYVALVFGIVAVQAAAPFFTQ